MNQTLLNLINQNYTKEDLHALLEDTSLDILDIIHAAFSLRQKYWNKDVQIHILNNAQNGYCPEDCGYCAQNKNSKAPIEKYTLKGEDELLSEAKKAYESGAHRYCMVFSGQGPSDKRIESVCSTIRKIKENYPLELCLSAGIMNDTQTQKLKDAGLDRLNHNLNTSENMYKKICTTHTYEDRINTLNAAKKAGLSICSGLIVGMGETNADIIDVAFKLKELESPSIPVNYFMPIQGTQIQAPTHLTPEYCLRVLALFRFTNPKAEIRIAAGRELHFRSLQVFTLYIANSLFMEGYLNTTGTDTHTTLQMIKDAGFNIDSDQNLDEILEKAQISSTVLKAGEIQIKNLKDLRPTSQN